MVLFCMVYDDVINRREFSPDQVADIRLLKGRVNGVDKGGLLRTPYHKGIIAGSVGKMHQLVKESPVPVDDPHTVDVRDNFACCHIRQSP